MLGNLICWGFALCLILTKANGIDEWYMKLLFAIGFILLGILSKAVDVYHETHSKEETTETNNT